MKGIIIGVAIVAFLLVLLDLLAKSPDTHPIHTCSSNDCESCDKYAECTEADR